MSSPSLRFLIVDPLDGVLVFARRLLEAFGFAGDAVHTFTDSTEAFADGVLNAPDFLITDWLPRANPTGLALYEQLKDMHPQCRVGFMAFEVTPEIEAAARAAGSRFLLKKPFQAEDLKRVLRDSMAQLGVSQPALAARVARETRGQLAPQRAIVLPPMPPPIKVGDQLVLAGKRHKVLAVVLSRGEQFAQLDGVKDLVPAYKLSR